MPVETGGAVAVEEDRAFLAFAEVEIDRSLAAGRLDTDSRDDLVVGTPFEDIGSTVDAGGIWTLYGSSSGISLTIRTPKAFNQGTSGIAGTPEASDHFGWSLAIARFDTDSWGDVVIGAPGEDLGSISDAGGIHILKDIATTYSDFWRDQDDLSGNWTSEAGDQFGFSVAAGYFNSGSNEDVAAGGPYENLGSDTDAGMVGVFYGASSNGGVTSFGFSENTLGGNSNDNEEFGYAIRGGYYNGGTQDLAVGAPGEIVSGVSSGAVVVVYSSSSGFSSSSVDQYIYQSGPTTGFLESGDRYGEAIG